MLEGSILIVDDGEGISELVTEILLSIGIENDSVVCCKDTADAESTIQSSPEGHFACLITDFNYPEGGAMKVVPVFQNKNPKAVIIGMSAGVRSLQGFVVDLDIHHVFLKPFLIQSFIKTLKELGF